MKFCPNCGHQVEPGAKFCPACGAQLPTEKESEEKAAPVDQPQASSAASTHAEAKGASHAEAPRDSQPSEPNQPQLGFVGSAQYVVKHAFEFNGDVPESRKSVFWWGYLGVAIVAFVLAFLPVIGGLFSWPLMIFLVSASMRRLAYINQNTGLGWLILVPIVGLYVFFLMLLDKKAE